MAVVIIAFCVLLNVFYESLSHISCGFFSYLYILYCKLQQYLDLVIFMLKCSHLVILLLLFSHLKAGTTYSLSHIGS